MKVEDIGMGIVDFCVASGLVKSKNEARTMIKSGAIKVNNQKIFDIRARLVLEGNKLHILDFKGE